MSSIQDIIDKVSELFSITFLGVSIGKIVLAVIIIGLTFIFRKIFVNIIMHYVRKITKATKNDIDDQLIEAIDPPARLLILSIGIMIAFKILGIDIGNTTFLGRVFRSILIGTIFWIFYRAANILTDVLTRVVKKTETLLADLLLPFLNKTIKIIIIILAATTILNEWGYNLGTLIAGLGIGGLAFALAAQDTISNLFGGLTIMLDRPFSIGDWIYTSEIEGTVEDIGFRSTKVRTFSQAIVTVPNSTLINTPVTNWSRMGKRRIKYNLGVTYSTTASQIEACVKQLKEMLENHEDVHKETIMVHFESFEDSSLVIFMYFFTKTTVWAEYLGVREDINLKIMNILEGLDVSFAFPSTSVYIEKSEARG